MDTVWQDLRYTFRLLRKSPGATLAIVATLALAIGANTAIFSVLNATVLRPLPFHDPSQLVYITSVRPERADAAFSLPEFLDYRRETRSLDALAAYANWSANLTGDGDAERLQGVRIAANAFDMLGVSAARGRLLTASDDAAASPRVAVISYGLWQRRFGGRPEIIGQAVRLNAESFTLIGVLPRSLPLPIRDVDVAVPLSPDRDPWRDVRSSVNFLRFIGRLRHGVTSLQAQMELTTICGTLRAQYPTEYATKRAVQVVDLRRAILGDSRRMLFLLVAAVGVVLAVAGANLATVLLLRAVPRERELAIRIASGATSLRIGRQLLTETAVLVLLGTAAGLVVAKWGIAVLVANGPADIQRLTDAALDSRVLVFTLAVSALLATAMGLVPVWHARRPAGDALRASRGAIGTRGQHRVRHALVALEMASALVLLVMAGALLRSLVGLQHVELGFRPAGVFAARVSLPAARYTKPAELSAFAERLTALLQRSPGVTNVGAVSLAPFSGLLATVDFSVVGSSALASEHTEAQFRLATQGYFETVGIRLVKGRLFDIHDTAAAPLVAVVSEALVDRASLGAEPIGRRLRIDDSDAAPREAQIVGVFANMRESSLERSSGPAVYLPLDQIHPGAVVWLANNQFWMVRTSGKADAFERSFREALQDVDPDAAASHARGFERYVDDSLSSRKFDTALMVLFAIVAVALAVIGLYTVVSYSVRQRAGEIAVRLALGATPRAVLWLMVGQGVRPVLLGWSAGALATSVASRLISGMLFQTTMTDMTVVAAATAVLFLVAAMAVLLPARRAAAIEPVVALRNH